ncbi:efflux RND transporter permease subunit [Vallitalea okinawensis]|uniref:efflux RND transporter permease subunit n=1 Tax=Vallitalea okinawensis TaxID=2078660 RepID=UPI000CFAEF16|nr:efflux RND transporter permease subunit [Vallitalea okinawensis]
MKNNELSELNQDKNFLGRISDIFIKRFRVVYLIIIGLVVMGYLIYQGMPRESMPEISANRINISVSYQGVSAKDIESLVTDPLENVLENVDDLDTISSTSRTGNSTIMLSFNEGTDMDDAMTDVRDKVSDVSLPEGAMPPKILELKSSEMPIMRLTVTGDVSMTELKYYGEVIQEQIESVTGVNNVELSGGYTREIQILVKQSELARYDLTISAITNSINSSNVSLPLSNMDLEGENYNLRIDESVSSLDDIANIVVRADENSYILLKDVAVISDGFKIPSEYSYYYINNEDEVKDSEAAIYLQVFRDDNYDMVKPAQDITNLVVNERDKFLPENINVIITQDESLSVSNELNTVLDSAISGFLVVIVVLFLFIGLNEALIVASVIPLSLFIAVILLDLNNMTFNTLTLTGFIIALGLLVDNAIVILENIDRLRDLGTDRLSASSHGTNQVAPAILAASMTTIVAFLPLLLMNGTVGEMIRSLPMTIVISIIASFLVSIVITPALSSRFLSKYKGGHKENVSKQFKWMAIYGSSIFVALLTLIAFRDFGLWSIPFALLVSGLMLVKKLKFTYNKKEESKSLAQRYKRFLAKIMNNNKRKISVIILSILLFFGSLSVLLTSRVSIELFPMEDPDVITISVTTPEGSLLDDTREVVYKIEEKLFKYDDIKSFNSSMGAGEGGSMRDSALSSSNEAEIEIDLKEDRGMSGIELMSLIREDVSTVAGGDIIVDANLSAGMASEDISVSFKGDDPDEIEQVGYAFYEQLLSTDGVVNPNFSSTSGAKELIISIDEIKAASYGFNAATLSQEIRNRIDGIKTINYTENDKEVDVTVYVDKDQITSVKDFEKLYFTSQKGEIFYFYDVAAIEVADAIRTISHQDGQNVVTISADVDPAYDLNSVVNDFNDKTEHITLPSGVEEVTGGGFGDMTDTMNSMMLGLAAAIMLVYIILSIQFNSLHQPLTILFSVPLAITGVMFGLLITGNNLGFYAMMGIVALVGIAVNDAIVLIDYMNYLRGQGIEKNEAILEGVKTRFTPVFATSITTIGGVLPLAVFNATYGQLGIALIFGLVASTFLTLLVIPVVYSAMDTMVTWIKSKLGIFIEHDDNEDSEDLI